MIFSPGEWQQIKLSNDVSVAEKLLADLKLEENIWKNVQFSGLFTMRFTGFTDGEA